MSNKHSESGLPGELNENWGSNYMMDGFLHDMDYGHGLEEEIGADPIPQPSTSGFSHLPDGVLLGDCEGAYDGPEAIELEDDGVDLANIEIVASFDPTSDPSTLGVVDHEWLGEAYQDPSRLPQNPVDDGIEQLQQAWGDRTDGIRRIDLRDRLETQPNLGQSRDNSATTKQVLVAAVRSAMRRSAAGTPIESLRDETLRVLGPERFARVAKAFAAIDAEHGLVGNVYVRASAYPGLHHGKWSSTLKKAARRARYLIAAPGEDCGGCSQVLGLTLVAHPDEINWDVAFARHASELAAGGRLSEVRSGDRRQVLREAFLRRARAPRFDIETTKPVSTMPSDGMSLRDARKNFRAAPAVARERIVDDRGATAAEGKLNRRLGTMVKARLLTAAEADALCKAGGSPLARLKMAELLAARTKTASYKGTTLKDPRVHISSADFDKAPAARHVKEDRVVSAAEEVERKNLLAKFFRLQEVVDRAASKVGTLGGEVDEGLRGDALRKRVAGLFDATERKLVASSLDPILVRGGFFDAPSSSEPRKFTGAVLRAAAPQRHEKLASPREIAGTVRWALTQMNDGFVGEELDHLLERRFSPVVLKAASTYLARARETHEGLAGHLYVDASTYVEDSSTRGCDVGALRHRANGIKHVLAMPRCASCVCRNANATCQKYNKSLVEGVEPSVADSFRREVLAAHRASDQEATASLFTSPDVISSVANPVSEYGLHNEALDDVDTAEPMRYGSLDDIFFGGLEV